LTDGLLISGFWVITLSDAFFRTGKDIVSRCCITDYIDLQRLRMGETWDVSFTVSWEMEMKTISPLILMTFKLFALKRIIH
jgi:hypothetical protein